MNLYDAIIDYMNEYWDSKGSLNFWIWLLQKGIDIKHDNSGIKTICADFDGTKDDFDALIDKFERQFPSKPTYDLEERFN